MLKKAAPTVMTTRRLPASFGPTLGRAGLLLALCCAACTSVPAPPSVGAVPDTSATALRAAALPELFQAADTALARPPQALASVHTEGLLPDSPVYQRSKQAKADWFASLALAIAAENRPDPRYRQKLNEYFEAWVGLYQPSLNPIDETDFAYLIFAYERGRPFLAEPLRQRTEALFRTMAEGYLNAEDPRPTGRNNWQSHRVKLASLLAFALDDAGLIQRSRVAFRHQVARNIEADGTLYDFRERDALRYVTYGLEPLLTAALVARAHGEDWYWFQSQGGASLNNALVWLADYAQGRKQHQEFAHTTVDFDRRRQAAGLPGYDGLWQPENASRTYQLASRLDPAWIGLAEQLGPAQAWLQYLYPRG
ncbi:MAG: alginate lyase [Nevskiaceae bacterium]|nr:MAG: alginate lyase [Nevskiaceae bacterium]TAM21467.1 MAG: alginate lyase [Nevskiaceae bacterium]